MRLGSSVGWRLAADPRRCSAGMKERSCRISSRQCPVVLGGEVRHAALRVVGHGPAEFLVRDLLVGHHLDHVGAGHEHLARALGHDGEVGDGRGVDRAPPAHGPMMAEIWGMTPRRQRVAQEDVGVAAEALPRPPGCGRPPESLRPITGAPFCTGQVHEVADLAGVGLGERAAEDGEVLGEHVDEPSIDVPEAGHHAVAGDLLLLHAEVGAAVGDEDAQFLKGAGVEQETRSAPGRSTGRSRASSRRAPGRRPVGLLPCAGAALRGDSSCSWRRSLDSGPRPVNGRPRRTCDGGFRRSVRSRGRRQAPP